MKAKPSSTIADSRRVALDMVELILRGTVAATVIAALAMGLIAFAAG